MLQNNIPLAASAATVDKIYAQATRSKFSDENRALLNPLTLEIAHGVSKDGTVSTVVIANDDQLVVGRELEGPKRVKVQIKFMYDPLGGRTDIESTIANLITDLASVTNGNLPSLLNKEV